VIPIKPQPEPSHFNEKVRQPGKAFLEVTTCPTGKDWDKKNLWKHIERDLYDAYDGICAYSCTWISRATSSSNVEHFKPKSKYPKQAYEWGNYRLVCWKMNKNKGAQEDVLDPFTLQEGWFMLDFSSLLIFPKDDLAAHETMLVKKTLLRLKLNQDEDVIEDRKKWLVEYILEEIPFTYLVKKAPFLAYELKRQRLDDVNHPMWDAYKKPPK